eukprot:GHVR01111332.1.p1 GENE.GHVR01111332.1~~GHVR01111332.1.p1  ORF type:complete len:453 (-),score=105.52 GHVR01111332.1:662-2020(-)
MSEFSGSSIPLKSPVIVNPWGTHLVAVALERVVRRVWQFEDGELFIRDLEYICSGSTQQWAEEMLLDLRRARKKEQLTITSFGFGAGFRVLGWDQHFRQLDVRQVVRAYKTSRRRLFLFDHEGTLAPVYKEGGDEGLCAVGVGPSESVKSLLCSLCADPGNTVVILSGRDRNSLEEWFGCIPNIGLCAEHGFYFKVPATTGDTWYCLSLNVDLSWKELALELMAQYVRRTQGAVLENKGSSLVFQYRESDPDLGQWQAQELHNHLSEMLFQYRVSIMSGKGYTEVKLKGVDKGVCVHKLVAKLIRVGGDIDMVLAMGDDRSDEDMFGSINRLFPSQYEEDFRTSSTNTVSPIQSGNQVLGGSCQLPTTRNPVKGRPSFKNNASNSNCFTVTVGKKPSQAKFYVNDTDDVTEVLQALQALSAQKQQAALSSQLAASASTLPYFIKTCRPGWQS